MTGPEHYKHAEHLIREAELVAPDEPQHAATMVQAAQVHATLALAAAQVADSFRGLGWLMTQETRAWRDAIGAGVER